MKTLGKNALILGLGESTLAAARFLCAEQVAVSLWDSRKQPPFLEEIRALPIENQNWGGATVENWHDFDFALISPGLDPEQFHFPANFEVISEIELFAYAVRQYCPESKILGITGSNGKTTTTLLTCFLLNQGGKKATACGNISPAALQAFLNAQQKNDFPEFWVLELSSFQLEKTFDLPLWAAVILNITEDHLERYHFSLEEYAQTKWKIFQKAQHQIVWAPLKKMAGLPWEKERLQCFPDHFHLHNQALYQDSQHLIDLNQLKMLGEHNALNAMASLMLCECCGLKAENLCTALKQFQAPAHRVEKILSVKGVDFIDDSKGTNVGATLAAWKSLSAVYPKMLLILGGDGKGQDFSSLDPLLQKRARAVLFIGKDGQKIQASCTESSIPMAYFPRLKEGFPWLMQYAQKGDGVLLSPACASLDQYANYAARAQDFAQLAKQWGQTC